MTLSAKRWEPAAATPPVSSSTPTGAAQYTSEKFAELCHRHGVSQSVGHSGVCWDNAPAESFLATWEDHYRHTTNTMAA